MYTRSLLINTLRLMTPAAAFVISMATATGPIMSALSLVLPLARPLMSLVFLAPALVIGPLLSIPAGIGFIFFM